MGFALPAVLTVTGVVTLVFVVAITALASLTGEAASARARVRFLQKAMTLEAEVAYLAATEPLTQTVIAVGSPRSFDDQFQVEDANGFRSSASPSEVRLDGHVYRVDLRGPMTLSLRDQAGMLNLLQLNDDQLRRLGEQLGIDRSELASLGPLLRDYVDTDDLTTAGGGEGSAYRGAGPANRSLLRPSEWLSVLGVRSGVSPSRWVRLRQDIAVDRTQITFNINTASAKALEIMFGLSPAQAQQAVEARSREPFSSLSALGAAAGAPIVDDGEGLYTFPSNRFVFTLSDGSSPWVYRARLTITPSDAEQPIWIDQTDIIESPRRTVADTTNATPFPYAAR